MSLPKLFLGLVQQKGRKDRNFARGLPRHAKQPKHYPKQALAKVIPLNLKKSHSEIAHKGEALFGHFTCLAILAYCTFWSTHSARRQRGSRPEPTLPPAQPVHCRISWIPLRQVLLPETSSRNKGKPLAVEGHTSVSEISKKKRTFYSWICGLKRRRNGFRIRRLSHFLKA